MDNNNAQLGPNWREAKKRAHIRMQELRNGKLPSHDDIVIAKVKIGMPNLPEWEKEEAQLIMEIAEKTNK